MRSVDALAVAHTRMVATGIVTALSVLLLACGRPLPKVDSPEPAPLSAAAYSHYLRGRIAIHEGSYDQAIRQFRAASLAAPDEVPIQVALIEALSKAGHRAEALRVAEQAQEKWRHDASVWLVSGALYRRAGRDDRAVQAYRTARLLDPDSEPAYLGLAASFVALDRPHRAEKTYRTLIDRRPDSITGRYRLARRLMQRQAYGPAEHQLRRVLELDPDHVRARMALARVLSTRGKKRDAIAMMRRAFDHSDGDPKVGKELLGQLLDTGDRAGALALLSELDRADLAAAPRLLFAEVYLQLGEMNRTIAIAEAVLADLPSHGRARLLKASALAELNRLDQAVSLLLDVLPRARAYPECRALAAELIARQGDYWRASALVERALALRPRHTGLVIARARVEELGGHSGRARAILRAAMAARPSHAELLYAYGAFEDRQGYPHRAVAAVEKILAADPDNATALNFVGYSLADRNIDLPRAERLLLRALDVAPGDGFILDSYGWLLFRQNRLDEALIVLERAARMVPREPEILWHLGELLLARQQPARAVELFEQARSLRPEQRLLRRIEKRIRALRPERTE
ncbi:MAG: tetratricopeptide repeat protein [Proteobacteria bacterium]|nr:tetratricopeptide repeat protein [Pseudomonadota bacterium]